MTGPSPAVLRLARAIARGADRLPTETGDGAQATARNIRLNAERLNEEMEKQA